MRKSWLTASLLALTVASPFAAADIQGHKAGDFIIRGGFATVDPDDSSSDIKLDGAKQRGTKATVDSDTQLGLTFTYMFADKWGVELVAATPFNHQVDVKGLARAWTASWPTSSNCRRPCCSSTTPWAVPTAPSSPTAAWA